MVFLNGNFIEKDRATISVMDRGFLFGDGIYEVIPTYAGKIFQLESHLNRLQKSLDAVNINNPYSNNKWQDILEQLLNNNTNSNQSLYLQITRGVGKTRQHSFDQLSPTVYIESNPLTTKSKQELKQGFKAMSLEDIRWHRCDIKSISLLPNVLYAQQAKQHQVEEVILLREQKITEGATSNVFMLKDNILFTHPKDAHILAGITRAAVLNSAKACQFNIQEKAFLLDDLKQADGLWISSSTREIMPITQLDSMLINNGIVLSAWDKVYDYYQEFKYA